MLYLLQLLRLLDNKQRKFFGVLFDDLSTEIDDMGYKGHETELVNDMLFNHFGFTLEDEQQLESFTKYILGNQGTFTQCVNRACTVIRYIG